MPTFKKMIEVEDYEELVQEKVVDFFEEFAEALAERGPGTRSFPKYYDDVLGADRWVDEYLLDDFEVENLRDAAELLDQLTNHETDESVWEGQGPIEAIKTMAFRTGEIAVKAAISRALGKVKEEYDEVELRRHLGLREGDDIVAEEVAKEIRRLVGQ